MDKPPVRYARSDGLSIAYQVVGEDRGLDVVLVPGFVSNLDARWHSWTGRLVAERMSRFSRFILFDKRGTGLSDPVPGVATLEERIDDVRAVMDAVGSPRAALFGMSEGVPMSLLFAATHPERVTELVLYGGMAKATAAPDYPFATSENDLIEAALLVAPHWGEGGYLEMFAPTVTDSPGAVQSFAELERLGATPDQLTKLYLMFLGIDVRHVLPTVRVPTLLLHKRGDRVVSVHAARWMAARIPGARLVEFPGIDHSWVDGGEDPAPILDEIEQFLTGRRPVAEPDRFLSTVMFTDIVSSTQKAADVGDHRWRELLAAHEAVVRGELERFRGAALKGTGDGFLATFDGPARAIRCGLGIVEGVRALGIDVRVGIHSGEIERVGQDIAGIGVHIASRVAGLASGGEVLVSETVKGLVAGSGIVFTERGEHALKGVPDRWRLFAAEG